MSLIHNTKRVVLPANSTTPKLVFRCNTANLQSVMLQCGGGDAKVLGNSKASSDGYLFQLGQQRIYTSADFYRVGYAGDTFELWMCAAGTDEVTISIESLIWGDGI